MGTDKETQEAYHWYMAEPKRTLREAAQKFDVNVSTLQYRFRGSGLPMKARGGQTRHSDAAIQQAYDWYVARPERSLETAAQRFGISSSTLKKRFKALGKARKVAGRGPSQPKQTVYLRVLADYRAGADVPSLCERHDLTSRMVLDILTAGSEVCTWCEILLREDDCGVAINNVGERICQDCVEVYKIKIDHWEREPEMSAAPSITRNRGGVGTGSPAGFDSRAA